MKHVLHVPENWKGQWGRTIRRIKREQKFLDSHFKYSSECNIQDGPESRFYQPLVDMANAILDFPTKYLPGESAKPWTPQRYLRNDPRRVLGGVINNLSPDIVAVHNKFLPTGGAGELDEWYLKGSNLTWAQPLQALEVKASDGALVDGSCMPRLKVNGEHATACRNDFFVTEEIGEDPQRNHAYPPTPSRAATNAPAAKRAAGNGVFSAPPALPPQKRPADELSEHNRKSQKLHHKSTPGGGHKGEVGEEKCRRPQTNETEHQKDAYLQVG